MQGPGRGRAHADPGVAARTQAHGGSARGQQPDVTTVHMDTVDGQSAAVQQAKRSGAGHGAHARRRKGFRQDAPGAQKSCEIAPPVQKQFVFTGHLRKVQAERQAMS